MIAIGDDVLKMLVRAGFNLFGVVALEIILRGYNKPVDAVVMYEGGDEVLLSLYNDKKAKLLCQDFIKDLTHIMVIPDNITAVHIRIAKGEKVSITTSSCVSESVLNFMGNYQLAS